MPTADLLDFNSLIAPVPGNSPAGQPLPDSVRMKLEESRKEPDPLEPSTASRRAEWPTIIQLAKDTLANSSKDLLVAARLAEALTKKHEFAGLRDGLKLMRLLVENCWDRMYPIPEDGEGIEVREGPFKWLNDSTRGAKFPAAIASIPLIKVRGEAFTCFDWNHPPRKLEFDAAIPTADAKKLKDLYDDLQGAMAELQALTMTLDEKLKDSSPDLATPENPTNIGNSLKAALDLVETLLKRKGIGTSTAAEEMETSDAEAATGGDGAVPLVASKTNREALYRQLEQIADALQRVEPHSPVPFFIKRAVRLGSLPFPELMRAIIRETSTLDELDRLLGLEQPKAE